MLNHPVKNPKYYRLPGVDTLKLLEYFNFYRGCALKYIIRAGKKEAANTMFGQRLEIQDLEKAIFYLNKEVEVLKNKL
jgi:hypothetical protein